MKIRPVTPDDFGYWLPLWDANNYGQRNEAVTSNTWARLIDEHDTSVNGLVAVKADEVVGLVHYILHPTTGSLSDVCYMQDVFVREDKRGQGIARKMVEKLSTIGQREGWARMVWYAEQDNAAAQTLYKNIGTRLDFTLHILPFKG